MVCPFVQRKVKKGLARAKKRLERFLPQFCIDIKLENSFEQLNFCIRISNYSHLEKRRRKKHTKRER
jgi:hypothetical protein